MSEFDELLRAVRKCTLCSDSLAAGPRPVLQVGVGAKVLIAGQAPGRRVHESGVPFDDPSGDRLRDWMGVDRETFYDANRIAILPMGFCYPGTGKNGDLPPRPECAPAWREQLLLHLPNVEFTIVLGKWAMAYHSSNWNGRVTDSVKDWERDWPMQVPLPHPSPRNIRWFRQNPWFESEVVPMIRERTRELLVPAA
jgi:uracil-DNA glycosylase